MRLTTWCGSVIETREYGRGIWLQWLEGWIRAGWRPIGIVCRARDRQTQTGRSYRVSVALEIARALAFLVGVLLMAYLLVGCSEGARPMPDLPREAPCLDYKAFMVPADQDIVPSIVPAPVGVRIVVDRDFWPFTGIFYPVPGGVMVSDVSVFRWYDGDHLGAIGRVIETGMCRWYAPTFLFDPQPVGAIAAPAGG
jgi:hypothetical protein